ncbi:DegT/DnrJ/EryC1/StrS family aminotransferase [Paenibacillus sp. MBLB4367]|uniref:DegT/DnrJ/EryC1/StrS family aminotransferase n=1 Tax=Paenibacillus sp. MBLB4367 TaxID=3384767 RepID=UPI003907F4CC
MQKLAINGGTPVRSKPLPPNYPGATVMGQEEIAGLVKVIEAQSPFRYYGPDMQKAVEQFENEMAQTLEVPYVLGVTSCTAALVVALKALGIGYGDKVIVPGVTFIASAGAVVCAGAVPVFVDVDDSLNMDAADLERVYDEDVKAIIAVSILGHPVHLDPVLAFARKHNIKVIEDVAQSCGVQYNGRYAGTMGDVGVYSFQMNKVLTSGEGGAVVTRDPHVFARAARYHDQGIFRDKGRYGIESPEETDAFVGQNYRMSELSGAVLLEQWRKMDGMVATMRKQAAAIKRSVAEQLPAIRFRGVVDEAGDIGSHVSIVLPDGEAANRFMSALGGENIQSYTLYGGRPVYMVPQLFHQRTADKDNFPFNYPFRNPVVYREDQCPRAVDLLPRSVFIPVSPLLTDEDAGQIAEGIVKVYNALFVTA